MLLDTQPPSLSLQQNELQEVPDHQGLYHPATREVMHILQQMLEAPWVGEHVCEKVKDIEQDLALSCEFCHLQALWHELAREVMTKERRTLPHPCVSNWGMTIDRFRDHNAEPR